MASRVSIKLEVTPDSRAAWRAWLEENHASSGGVWLVLWKKGSGQPTLSYGEAVEEALCFGWIDSVARPVDGERYKQRFSPRKAGSGWSRPNKERVERLVEAGLMAPSGAAKIEAAKADGSWSKLDDVESLLVPDDLRSALDASEGASAKWDAFARSARRGILEWIGNAKTAGTRTKRFEQTARMAARNKRALFDRE